MTEDEFEKIAARCRLQMALSDAFTERFRLIGVDATGQNLFDIARKMGLRDDETDTLTQPQALRILDDYIHHLAELERSREMVEGIIAATPSPVPKGPRVVLTSDGALVDGKRKPLNEAQRNVIQALLEAGAKGLTKDELDERSGHPEARKILDRLRKDADWKAVIVMPGKAASGGYRILT